jgi:3-methyladenine DNA glycosylase AlkD
LIKKEYNTLVDQLKERSDGKKSPSGYSGSDDLSLGLKVPAIRKVAKDFVRSTNLSIEDKFKVLERLIEGRYADEKYLVGKIIEYDEELKDSIKPRQISKWLEHLEGWCQIDTICQSNFKAEDLIKNWQEWKAELINLSKSDNISKRRASLVLLTKSVSQIRDDRLVRLSFSLINRLKTESDRLITKAISWLLRSMIKHYRFEVKRYLDKEEDNLPAIAVRETRKKMKTGTKS